MGIGSGFPNFSFSKGKFGKLNSGKRFSVMVKVEIKDENLFYSIDKLKEIIEDSITSQKDRIRAIELLCQLEGYLEEKY